MSYIGWCIVNQEGTFDTQNTETREKPFNKKDLRYRKEGEKRTVLYRIRSSGFS